jgi:hypothetical protein
MVNVCEEAAEAEETGIEEDKPFFLASIYLCPCW